MKRIFSFLVCLSVLCVLIVPAFADDETDSVSDSGSSAADTSGPSSPAESPPSSPAVDTSAPVSDSGSSVVDAIPETPAAPAEDVDFTTSVDSADEVVPIQYLETEGVVQTDSPSVSAFSAVSVYDLASVSSDIDAPASSVSYTLTPINFFPEYIEWSFQDGYFFVFLTDVWFAQFFPDVSRAEVLASLSSFDYVFSVNGVSADGLFLDFSVGSFSFPYVEDGSYMISSDDINFSFEAEITSIVVPGSSPGSSLISAVKALFGEYTPQTYNVTTYLSDGTAVQSTEIVPGLAGLDYEWLASVTLFALALYCILRMIGGALKWS